MQAVLLIWTDGRVRVPLGVRLWRKGGRSKVELAAELLREAHRRGLSPEYVLFDSWYAASTLLHLLADLGWKYVARLKSNRLFDGRPVRDRWPHRFGPGSGSAAEDRPRVLRRQRRAALLRLERHRPLVSGTQAALSCPAADRRGL